jgi:hypothetical protein
MSSRDVGICNLQCACDASSFGGRLFIVERALLARIRSDNLSAALSVLEAQESDSTYFVDMHAIVALRWSNSWSGSVARCDTRLSASR